METKEEMLQEEDEMVICALCGEKFIEDEETLEYIGNKADRCGMEALTENEQCILEGMHICEDCM